MQQYKIRPLNEPNLPEYQVNDVIISSSATEAINTLSNLGITVNKVDKCINLPDYLSTHADLQYFHYNKNNIFCADKEITGEYAQNLKLTRISKMLDINYPDDVPLNAASIRNYLICNKKYIAREIIEKAEIDNKIIIDVKQGYTKCSVCVVDNESIITDDESIYRAVQNYLNDVLLISKGSIRLNGQNYGFIGGCTGKLAKNIMAVNGRIDSHSDCNKIIDMLSKHNIEIIELTNDYLTDIGSILPITEKVPVL